MMSSSDNNNSTKQNRSGNNDKEKTTNTTINSTATTLATKKKSIKNSTTTTTTDGNSTIKENQAATLASLLRSMNLIVPQETPKSSMQDFKFWSTQPVPRLDERIEQDGPIEQDKPKYEIRKESYPLPKGYEWCTVDLNDSKEARDVYELLTMNYVEDDDATFRFDYSVEFLKWALKPPGWKKDWHVGVRTSESKKLIGFIGGIPVDLKMKDRKQIMVEINFLCVHKKLRSKRLAPVLIKEITRRVHLEGIFQAVYTAGTFLPKPVTSCRYYHRNMNPKKLIETGFSSLGSKMNLSKTIKLFKLPNNPVSDTIREMRVEDVPQVTKLFNKYMSKFSLRVELSEEEVAHWLLPRDKIVFTYVVEQSSFSSSNINTNNKILEFVSFYSLPSTVIKNPHYSHINAAYLFYYAPRDEAKTDPEFLKRLMQDALILACNQGFDVFNCLNLMDNEMFLDDLKFGRGDGTLHYYLYNYKFSGLEPQGLGLVMM